MDGRRSVEETDDGGRCVEVPMRRMKDDTRVTRYIEPSNPTKNKYEKSLSAVMKVAHVFQSDPLPPGAPLES